MRYPDATDLLRHWFFILPFAGDWNYQNTDTWPATNPQCGGLQQSPIALNSRRSDMQHALQLQFRHYRKPLHPPVEVINNGYSAEIGIRINEDRTKPVVTVAGYPDWYEVQAVHFHWGSKGVLGSEHSLDGERYDLEMHVVHKNDKYATVEEARDYPDGFIVLAVLFEAFPETEKHRTLNEIYNALESITRYNTTSEIAGPITMQSFLPDLDTHEYFSYKGSLTTPPCSESVLWFVFTEVLPISYKDLRKFWNLIDAKGAPLVNNFRPIRNGHRPVYLKRNTLRYFD